MEGTPSFSGDFVLTAQHAAGTVEAFVQGLDLALLGGWVELKRSAVVPRTARSTPVGGPESDEERGRRDQESGDAPRVGGLSCSRNG